MMLYNAVQGICKLAHSQRKGRASKILISIQMAGDGDCAALSRFLLIAAFGNSGRSRLTTDGGLIVEPLKSHPSSCILHITTFRGVTKFIAFASP